MRSRQSRWFVLLTLVCAVSQGEAKEEPAVPQDLLTVAESSGFTKTCKSEEVVALADRLCARSKYMERFTFGKTFEGKPMVCVKVARPMVASPEALASDPRPVVLVIGNIHSGECCGKEALLMLLRDLALNEQHPWLDEVVLLIAPNYNADGNDKFGPNEKQRKNQDGPEEMGTRENAQGFDLNRDFVKLASPEARALVGLMNTWNPHLFIDCHTTNGSWHRYPLTYDVPHNPATPKPIRQLLRERLLPDVTKQLEAKGIGTFYYGNFSRDHKQWTTYGYEPRYSTEYVGLRGRLAILSEAYSYIPFKDRIVATKAFVEACVNWVRAHPKDVHEATALPAMSAEIPIASRCVAFPEKYVVRGYELPASKDGEARDPRPRGKGPKPTVPKDHTVDFLGDYVPTRSVKRPFAYVVPPTSAMVVRCLLKHGVVVQRLTQDLEVSVQVTRILSATKTPTPFQGHHLIRDVEVERRDEVRTLSAGSLIVRADQPLGTMLAFFLEPQSADGFVTWELFGDAFRVDAEFPVLRLETEISMPLAPLAR